MQCVARVDAWILVPSFMADGGNTSWVGCILLKDLVGEREGHFSWLGLVQAPPATVNIQRGELLVPRRQKEESSLQDHQQLSQFKLACKLCRDSNISIQYRPDEIAWLNAAEFDILEAVQSPLNRYEEFCMDRKLSWASKLKLGSVVHVQLTSETQTMVEYAEGVVRYIGKIGKNPGQMFGVEITESRFRGLGSSSGRYHDIRYFPCDNRCGEFVAVDRLSRMKTEHKRKFPASNPSHSSDLSESLERKELSFGDRVVVYSRKNVPIHGTVKWRGRHWSLGDIVGIETDILVSRGDFSDAIPGLADEFSIDPDHGRVVLPENLILKETKHRRRSLSPVQNRSLSPTRDHSLSSAQDHSLSSARDHSLSSARDKERSPTPRAAKHYNEDDKQTRALQSDPLPDIPIHRLPDPVRSHDPLAVLNQELEKELRSQEQQIRQQQEQIARLRIQLTKMAANGKETEQKLAVTEQQLAEQQAESDQLKQTLSSIQDENVELRRRVMDQEETMYQLWQRNAELEDQLRQKNTSLSEPIHFWEVSGQEVEVLPTVLGTGAWGWVSEAIFRGKLVAVKRLHKDIVSRFTVDHIRREINIMAQVRHPNLVLFIAAVMDSEEGPLIITEILSTSLRKAANQNILGGNSVKLNVFHDVAAALNYLHQHREPIIHRDVSSSNVLLERLPQNKWRAKLSDFGSANLARSSTTPGEGAVVYAAPEAAMGPQSPKMDVYSFGVLICEIVTGEFPSDSSVHRMLLSVKQTWPSIHRLTMECVERNVLERPTMNRVLQNLKRVHIDL